MIQNIQNQLKIQKEKIFLLKLRLILKYSKVIQINYTKLILLNKKLLN